MTLQFHGLQKGATVPVSLLITHYDDIDAAGLYFGYVGDGETLDVARFCDLSFEEIIKDFHQYLNTHKIQLMTRLKQSFNPLTEQEMMDEYLEYEYILFTK